MKKQTIFYIILGVAIVIAAILFFRPNAAGNDNNEIILFYGQECTHCQRVEQFIKDNKIDEKIKFENKEVYHNQKNALLMGDKAKQCSINADALGVPFLSDGRTCYVGEYEVTNFFKQKAGI